MIHYSKIINGLMIFIDRDLLSKMSGSWKAWGIGTIVALVSRKGPEVFEKIRSNSFVHSMGLIDGEMVDIDSIYSELYKQAQKSNATVDIPLIGSVTYSAKDVEEIYHCIMG